MIIISFICEKFETKSIDNDKRRRTAHIYDCHKIYNKHTLKALLKPRTQNKHTILTTDRIKQTAKHYRNYTSEGSFDFGHLITTFDVMA